MTGENTVARHDDAYLPPLFDVTYTVCADGVHLAAIGEIDSASAPTFVAGLQSAIAEADGTLVVVDLGGVTFIDSSGLAALLEARESAKGQLRLGTLHPIVHRLLEISGLLAHFPRTVRSPDDDTDLDRRC